MLMFCSAPSQILWLCSVHRAATTPSFDSSFLVGKLEPVVMTDRLCKFCFKSEFYYLLSGLNISSIYISVLQGSGGQTTVTCLVQHLTSKCWRIFCMCSTEMGRFWWRRCPGTWMGQNLTSLRTWTCVLWTTSVGSVVLLAWRKWSFEWYLFRYIINKELHQKMRFWLVSPRECWGQLKKIFLASQQL